MSQISKSCAHDESSVSFFRVFARPQTRYVCGIGLCSNVLKFGRRIIVPKTPGRKSFRGFRFIRRFRLNARVMGSREDEAHESRRRRSGARHRTPLLPASVVAGEFYPRDLQSSTTPTSWSWRRMRRLGPASWATPAGGRWRMSATSRISPSRPPTGAKGVARFSAGEGSRGREGQGPPPRHLGGAPRQRPPPIALYEKWGFTAAAMRPRYYPDNREDALVMWKEKI